MNNNRLSSNVKKNFFNENLANYVSVVKDIDKLLQLPSNLEVTSEGKVWIKSEQRYLKGRGSVAIAVLDESGVLVNSFYNLESAASYFNTPKHLIKYRLDTGKSIKLDGKVYFFKRNIALSAAYAAG